MGASGWEYFVPYQPDIAAALRDLRHEEYRLHFGGRDNRADTIKLLRSSLDDGQLAIMYPDPEGRQYVREDTEERIRLLESLPVPTNIDEQIQEVLQLSMEEGTGTILDMEGLSDHEEYFKIAPLSSAEMSGIFGTDKPDHDVVAANRSKVTNLRDSQKGTYLIIYRDGQPDEIYFCGFSGD